jgi:hypothetical protein
MEKEKPNFSTYFITSSFQAKLSAVPDPVQSNRLRACQLDFSCVLVFRFPFLILCKGDLVAQIVIGTAFGYACCTSEQM